MGSNKGKSIVKWQLACSHLLQQSNKKRYHVLLSVWLFHGCSTYTRETKGTILYPQVRDHSPFNSTWYKSWQQVTQYMYFKTKEQEEDTNAVMDSQNWKILLIFCLNTDF